MKNLCRNYLSGSCRYGDRCRFIHPKITSLLDPPSWIYTNVYNNQTNLNCLEISTDEVRYSLLINDTRKILDDIWFDNYCKMYKSLNEICRVGIGRSTSNRVVDLRVKPEVFNLPFDLGRVEQKIVELRKDHPVMGEGDVMKGEEEEEEGEVKKGEVKEGVPKFVKEYQEREYRDHNRDREYNREREYNRDRPYSFRQPDNRYPPRDQYPPRDGNRDINRDRQYISNFRDNKDQYPPRDINRDQQYRSSFRDQPYRDNKEQYPREQYHRDNPPFRQDSYNKPPSHPRSPQRSQPSSYRPSYPRPSQGSSYPPSQPPTNFRPSQGSSYPPSQRPSYPPSQSQPKKEEDPDFEYKNIPYNFDRK